jgi:hypothetical protein
MPAPPILPKIIPWITPYGNMRGRFFPPPPVPTGTPTTSYSNAPGAPRAYFNQTVAADSTSTYDFAGWGNVVGPGTYYPLPPIESLDQVLAYYWRRYSAQLSSIDLTITKSDSSTGIYTGALAKTPYSVKNGLRTFGFPASTDTSKPPTLMERAAGFRLLGPEVTIAGVPTSTGNQCGIYSPSDTSGVVLTASPVLTSHGPKTITCPCGHSTTDIISIGAFGAPVFYSVPPFYSELFLIFPSSLPIYYTPDVGYYLPCAFPGTFPVASVSPQEITTTVTDYTTTDFAGDPLITTTFAATISAATWTLDGMSGAFYDPGAIEEAIGSDSVTIPAPFSTTGTLALQTFDSP